MEFKFSQNIAKITNFKLKKWLFLHKKSYFFSFSSPLVVYNNRFAEIIQANSYQIRHSLKGSSALLINTTY